MCYKERKSTPLVHVNFLIIKAKLLGNAQSILTKGINTLLIWKVKTTTHLKLKPYHIKIPLCI